MKIKHWNEKEKSYRINLFQALYLWAVILLTLLTISTPYIVKDNLTFGKDLILAEEIIECSLIALMLLLGYAVIKFYRDQMEKSAVRERSVEEQLGDAIKYIGRVNVQIAAIKSNLNSIRKYPQYDADFDKTLKILAQSALGITGVDWVEFRIIELDSHRTIREHQEAKAGSEVPRHSTSNRAMVEGRQLPGYSVISSEWENLNVKAFCILPIDRLRANQTVFVKDLVGELEMLFVIFASQYYKNSYFKNPVDAEHQDE